MLNARSMLSKTNLSKPKMLFSLWVKVDLCVFHLTELSTHIPDKLIVYIVVEVRKSNFFW